MPTATIVDAWGVSRQALDQARERGDLVGLKVSNRQYYPAAFVDLAATEVASVCRALRGVDPVSGVLFWSRKHGSLDDRTVTEAIRSEGSSAAVHAAEAFADEMSGANTAQEDGLSGAHAS